MKHIKDIYPLVEEVRQRIIETMRQRGIKTVTFCPDEETYEQEHEDDEEYVDFYEYRDDNCPCVVFFDKYNLGGDYFVMSVELVDGEHPYFKMQCNGENGDATFWDDDLMRLSMLNVYESLEMELGIDETYWLVADYNEWVKEDGNKDKNITAILDRDEEFLFDVLDEGYVAMEDAGLVECGVLTRELSDDERKEWQARYGILWTDKQKKGKGL